jgi:hypothetical protein
MPAPQARGFRPAEGGQLGEVQTKASHLAHEASIFGRLQLINRNARRGNGRWSA